MTLVIECIVLSVELVTQITLNVVPPELESCLSIIVVIVICSDSGAAMNLQMMNLSSMRFTATHSRVFQGSLSSSYSHILPRLTSLGGAFQLGQATDPN